jgi:hypothetical protein
MLYNSITGILWDFYTRRERNGTMPGRLIAVENKMGAPMQAGDLKITPFSRVWRFQIPGQGNGMNGIIWNRPLSILVETKTGEEHVLPVIDITRQAQWGILGVTVGLLLVAWLFRRKVF